MTAFFAIRVPVSLNLGSQMSLAGWAWRGIAANHSRHRTLHLPGKPLERRPQPHGEEPGRKIRPKVLREIRARSV